jgi:hypothetical protein
VSVDYKTISPSECAEAVLKDILKVICETCSRSEVGCLECEGLRSRRGLVENLLRRRARELIEACAMEAEDFVATYDTEEHLTGMETGDAIAEHLRQTADERRAASTRAYRRSLTLDHP